MSYYDVRSGNMCIYEMPYGAEIYDLQLGNGVTVKTVEEAKMIIESMTRFIESRKD